MPSIHTRLAYTSHTTTQNWTNCTAVSDRDHRTHGPGAPRRQGHRAGGSPICYCACVWCCRWI